LQVIQNIVDLSEQALENARNNPEAFRGPFLDFNSPLPPFDMDKCKKIKEESANGALPTASVNSSSSPTSATPVIITTSTPDSPTSTNPSTPTSERKTIIGKRPIIISKKTTESPSTPPPSIQTPVITTTTVPTTPPSIESPSAENQSSPNTLSQPRTIIRTSKRASITMKSSPLNDLAFKEFQDSLMNATNDSSTDIASPTIVTPTTTTATNSPTRPTLITKTQESSPVATTEKKTIIGKRPIQRIGSKPIIVRVCVLFIFSSNNFLILEYNIESSNSCGE
jgi:hypothetical protein